VLELKTIRVSSHDPKRAFTEGLEQTARYAERSNAGEAHLVVCDERPEHCANREIHVWGV
jgi:hypothetical protein